jgi:squalene-associated FAD-dependent desaturase
VVVVGGGLAGITAALDCADAGAAVTLLESRSRLGGATWSFQRDGVWFDNGQHVFLRCCDEYRALLERLGVAGDVHLQDRFDLPVLRPHARAARLRRNRLPAPAHLVPSLLAYRHLSWHERATAGRAALAMRRLDPADAALDEQTFGSWLAAHGQSPASVARLWDLICVPTLNLPAAEASLALAAKVFRTGLLDDASGSDLGWARVPLGALHADAATRALAERGVDVVPRVHALEVSRRRGTTGFAVRTERGAWHADAAVVAVPNRVAAQLVPEAAAPGAPRGWAALGASPIVNVQVVYDRRVTDLPCAAAVDSPVQFVFDRTEPAGLRRGQSLGVSISAADAIVGVRADALIARFTAELATLFPAARRANVLDAVVTREQAATFRGVPGTARLRPRAQTAWPGLALAGAWTATGWPATMEGAVRSGHAASRVALLEAGGARRGVDADEDPEEVVA